jgi:hypothetical protein
MIDRQSFAAGLRAAADFFESSENVDFPYGLTMNVFPSTKDDMAAIARSYAPLKKKYEGNLFILVKDFGGGVILEFNLMREKVCQRVVTGTRTVTKPKMVQDGMETKSSSGAARSRSWPNLKENKPCLN